MYSSTNTRQSSLVWVYSTVSSVTLHSRDGLKLVDSFFFPSTTTPSSPASKEGPVLTASMNDSSPEKRLQNKLVNIFPSRALLTSLSLLHQSKSCSRH
jgi:hypothetical protein